MSKTVTTSKVPLCVVTIGVDDLLLPSADGMKLVQLLQKAQRVQRRYVAGSGGRYAFVLQDVPEVQWMAVRPDQLYPAGSSLARPGRKPETLALLAPEAQ